MVGDIKRGGRSGFIDKYIRREAAAARGFKMNRG
jgi:hypothetical protein